MNESAILAPTLTDFELALGDTRLGALARRAGEAAARYTLIAHHGEQTPAAARLARLFENELRAAGVRIPRPQPR